ncbi:MAG: GH36 C-terminal domain-containing protein, partial [Hyphomicrobiales bacterium]|nr:GH36 C-terminal domain-containing protein [Hyphomicrobiales bacterium]
GTFHRITTVDENLLGAATISEDQISARVVMMQIDRPRSVIPPNIAVPGLDPDRNYKVTMETPLDVAKRASRRFDNPLMDDGLVMSGSVLGSAGIQLPVLYAQTGVALALEAV